MKKRIAALLLALAMIVTYMPAMAFAEDEVIESKDSTVQIVDDNSDKEEKVVKTESKDSAFEAAETEEGLDVVSEDEAWSLFNATVSFKVEGVKTYNGRDNVPHDVKITPIVRVNHIWDPLLTATFDAKYDTKWADEHAHIIIDNVKLKGLGKRIVALKGYEKRIDAKIAKREVTANLFAKKTYDGKKWIGRDGESKITLSNVAKADFGKLYADYNEKFVSFDSKDAGKREVTAYGVELKSSKGGKKGVGAEATEATEGEAVEEGRPHHHHHSLTDNYVLANVGDFGKLTGIGFIAQKEITINGIGAKDKIYDGNDTATLYRERGRNGYDVDGVVRGDRNVVDFGAITGKFVGKHNSGKNAGFNKLVAIDYKGAVVDDNYKLNWKESQKTTTANIFKKNVTATVSAAKTYDGDANLGHGELNVELNGILDGEKVWLGFEDAHYTQKDAGKCFIVLENAYLNDGRHSDAADNYNLVIKNFQPKFGKFNKFNNDIVGPAEIFKKELTMNLYAEKTYDGTDALNGFTVKQGHLHGVVGHDNVRVDLLKWSKDNKFNSAKATQNGGATEISVAAKVSGKDAKNYYMKGINPWGWGSLTGKGYIHRAWLGVEDVTAADRFYEKDNVDAEITGYTLKGLKGEADVTIEGLTGTFEDDKAGVDKPVTVHYSKATLAGEAAGNYVLNLYAVDRDTTATINKVKVAVPTTKNYVFDGNAHTGIIISDVNDPVHFTGDYVMTKVGKYHAAAVLDDPENYEWADGTIEDKEFDWEISAAPVVEEEDDDTTGANTGDANNMVPYGIAGIIALAGIAFVAARRRKTN